MSTHVVGTATGTFVTSRVHMRAATTLVRETKITLGETGSPVKKKEKKGKGTTRMLPGP